MRTTKRKPVSVGEILVEEFIKPHGLTQGALAEAMGVQRREHANRSQQRRGARRQLRKSTSTSSTSSLRCGRGMTSASP